MEGKKVLLIEDHPSVALVLEIALTALDEALSVQTVQSGETAQKAIAEGNWDLVIVDYSLPGMNGLELVRRIRTENDSAIPWLLITAYGHQKVLQEAVSLGANAVLTKPFSIAEFQQIVGSYLKILNPIQVV